MTVLYDPLDAEYTDEAAVRHEMARTHDVCGSCRRCVDLCGAFPTLFEMLDSLDEPDAGRLTPAQQDLVVDECFHCKLCAVGCPHSPALSNPGVDVPRMMVRAEAMRHEHGHTSVRAKLTTQIMGRTDLLGKLGSSAAPLANRIAHAEPDSLLRRVAASVTGVSSTRVLAPYARERFSTWFAKRPKISLRKKQAAVTVYPTCLVEYRETGIGKDLVKVYERNGIECSNSSADCCGAHWLHAGDTKRFAKIATDNVKRLADEVRSGTDIVVPQPTCAYVLQHEYADHVDEPLRDDARLVAEHTYDATHYLMTLHREDDYVLDTDFGGEMPRSVTYHAPCRLRAQEVGLPSRDLLRLTGARVDVVQQCSGMGDAWGLRAENDDRSSPMADELGARIDASTGEEVVGDCHLANTVIGERSDAEATHPLQLIARAYGIPEST